MAKQHLDTIGAGLQAMGWAVLPVLALPFICLCLGFIRKENLFLIRLQIQLILMVEQICIFIGEVTKWLLVALVVSTAFGVLALSIFGRSWAWLDESAQYMHATVLLFGAGITLLAGQHVRVDLFYARFNIKQKALVNLAGYYALLIPFCLLLIYEGQSTISLAWLSREGSANPTGIQGVYLLKTFIPLGMLVLLGAGFSIAGRAALVLSDKNMPAPTTRLH